FKKFFALISIKICLLVIVALIVFTILLILIKPYILSFFIGIFTSFKGVFNEIIR
ncbi:murein biosynthesis integral membrane protein MurJ, partial [Campylobacter jejuni]